MQPQLQPQLSALAEPNKEFRIDSVLVQGRTQGALRPNNVPLDELFEGYSRVRLTLAEGLSYWPQSLLYCSNQKKHAHRVALPPST